MTERKSKRWCKQLLVSKKGQDEACEVWEEQDKPESKSKKEQTYSWYVSVRRSRIRLGRYGKQDKTERKSEKEQKNTW